MNNQESLRFFENLSQQPVTMEITKFNPSNDHSQLDTDFIRQFITNQSDVLDLGTGAEVVDIYPPSFNRWDNTHFYALVASVEP